MIGGGRTMATEAASRHDVHSVDEEHLHRGARPGNVGQEACTQLFLFLLLPKTSCTCGFWWFVSMNMYVPSGLGLFKLSFLQFEAQMY